MERSSGKKRTEQKYYGCVTNPSHNYKETDVTKFKSGYQNTLYCHVTGMVPTEALAEKNYWFIIISMRRECSVVMKHLKQK